ncbi:Acetyltransferase [Mucinivorans hirudinis]|uniref:Acetyltransferase n=1 Tax=Mucinivorans hirudinis TaxID=1433126 RepID=A0A060REA9_9BACT|nr:Acetyltransferase [Mucinivorans hirudinis]
MITDGVVILRAMELDDLEVMYRWENDTSLWALGDNTMPFSKRTLKQFIEQQSKDFFATRQMRLIVEVENRAVGCADLFDFSPLYRRAAVGILVYNERGKGYGVRALRLLSDFAFARFGLEQLYSHVPLSNVASYKMCARVGFVESGILRRWCGQEDVAIMQYFG